MTLQPLLVQREPLCIRKCKFDKWVTRVKVANQMYRKTALIFRETFVKDRPAEVVSVFSLRRGKNLFDSIVVKQLNRFWKHRCVLAP